MAYQAVTRGFFDVPKHDETYALSASIYQLNAVNEICATVGYPPKAGNIDRIWFRVAAVGNAPDNGLQASLQSISASDGLNTGTILGATSNAKASTAAGTPSAVGGVELTLAEVAAVTTTVPIAVVIGSVSFTAGDDVTIAETNRTGDCGFPFSISSTNGKRTATMPIMAVRYDDGTWWMLDDEIPPFTAVSFFDYDNGTATKEVGERRIYPFPVRITRLRVFIFMAAANGSVDLHIYDDSNTDLITPITHDTDWSGNATAGRWVLFHLPTPLDVAANTAITVAFEPTTTVNLRIPYGEFDSAGLMQAMPPCHSGWYARSRGTSGSGAWTDYNNGTDAYRRIRGLALELSGFDDGTGGGGGTTFPVIGGGGVIF
jgi:hypothetical protein